MAEAMKPEVRAALNDFQRYLSDQIAPLMALDAIETVIRQPPEVAAAEIHAWTSTQFRGPGAQIPISDYLFHAVKKIQHFADLDLVPAQKITTFLEALRPRVLDLCPPEDRQFLDKNLSAIGKSRTDDTSTHVVYRQPGTETKLATAREAEGGGATAKRMNLIMERLARFPVGAASSTGAAAPSGGVISEAVSTAASAARTHGELDENLARIREAGVDVDPSQLFRYLGNSLPNWAVPLSDSAVEENGEFPPSEGQPIEAMKKLISLSGDPQETARRFRQFIDAAIEQFNEGSLGRAVTMFELAENLLSAGLIPNDVANKIRHTAVEKLDATRLRSAAETRESHYLLRKVLNFFPDLRAEGLLTGLQNEERRDRRRLMLALAELHGEDARRAVLAAFATEGGDRLASSDKYFTRNLLYLLNRIPTNQPAGDDEVRLAESLSAPRHPTLITKEAVVVLGQSQHPRATEVIVKRLGEYEALLSKGESQQSAKEIRQLLDRIVAALVKLGDHEALSAAVDHGLSREDSYGDTLSRITALGSRDLSSEPAIMHRLIDAVHSELPRRVLGLVVRRQSGGNVDNLLDALSGTDSPEVIELLEMIRQKHSDRDFAQKARTILESAGLKASTITTVAPSLSGDLELFGLPNLVQNLASNGLSGLLTIMDREGKTVGALTFDSGKIARCHVGDLRGRDAVFQLFEQSVPGTFTFSERADLAGDDSAPPLDVMPLILEALRRHDELRSAKAIVPPDVGLQATGAKPAHDPREKDPKVIREVWLKAISGEPPRDWEKQVPVDSYRVWKLLAYWVETGALEPHG